VPEVYEVAVPVTGLWSGPEAPRALDVALTDTPPRLAEWLAAQGPAERRQLWGRLDSQLLLGERVIAHSIDDGWARVTALQQPSTRGSAGYPGFVRADHLHRAVDGPADGRVVVHHPVTAALDAPYGTVVMSDISFGTILPEIGRDADHVSVRLPSGVTGWLPSSHVDRVRSPDVLPSATELVSAGRQFLGVGYLAAGVHGLCFDCSGLVHAVYRRFGVTVPRDAHDQAAIGQEVALDAATFGDLMFFSHPESGEVYHVGFWLDWPRMLHASQTDWAVIDTPLTDARRADLSQVRRLHSGRSGAV